MAPIEECGTCKLKFVANFMVIHKVDFYLKLALNIIKFYY